MSLGRKINYARVSKGMTQEELANKAGISIKSVQRAEKNVQVSMEIVQKISQVLGIEYKDVFDAKKYIKNISKEFTNQVSMIKRSILFNNNYMIKRILKVVNLQKDEAVMDLACGPGVMTRKMAKKTKNIWGVDACNDMLFEARKTCEEAGLNHVQFARFDTTKNEFEDEKFDVIVTRFLFHHLNNPEEVLSELSRVLKSDGRLIICDISTSEKEKESKLHNAIEAIRDPSHVKMLSNNDYIKLFSSNHFKLDKFDAFEVVRGYDEWLEITNAPHRYEPLLEIVNNLIEADRTAGVNLRSENGKVFFNQTIVIYELKKAW